MDKPTYKHDCVCCVFLGRYNDAEEIHDLYVCRVEAGRMACFVVVRSDDPERTYGIFQNGLETDMTRWPGPAEALRRASARGLL